MAATERITMTMRELDRFKVIQDVADGTAQAVACGRTARADDAADTTPGGATARTWPGWTGLAPAREAEQQPDWTRCWPIVRLAIIRERYADFGPTLACEKLRECHGIRLAKETVRRLMTDAGLWMPRRQRPPKIYQPRARRACLGELIQIDGSDHRWFEERAPACTLLVYVDDATSRLMALHFTARGNRTFRAKSGALILKTYIDQ